MIAAPGNADRAEEVISMSDNPFQALFHPGVIGTMSVRNRIVMPPMGTNFGDAEGFVTERTKAYYTARARGGAGLIIVEIISVDAPGGKSLVGNLSLHDDAHIPAMAELAGLVKGHGAAIAAQLFHAGAETHRTVTGVQPVGPSVVRTFTGDTPRELTITEINAIAQQFARAAVRAKAAGFGAVEIHGATYYLLAQFLSPHWNKRNDDYGGPLRHRARFLLEVLGSVRDAVGPDYPVWCRINGAEFGFPEALTADEARQVAQWAEAGGAQAIHVSAFGGGARPDMGPTVLEHGVLLPLAREIKKDVSIPVIAVGRIDPHPAALAVQKGEADFIAVGRGLIADPDLPNKLARGSDEDIRPCIGCLECIRHIMVKRLPLRCSVNALCGREGEFRLDPSPRPRSVTVIGGGPGGMEAARVAALRGHRVTLFEKSSFLGGLCRPAAVPPGKDDIHRFLAYLERQLYKLGVRVTLNREFTREDAAMNDGDALIVACGALPHVPEIPGLDGSPFLTAAEALLGAGRIGQKVLIVGGGLAGLETADFLSAHGHTVTVVEMLERLAPDMSPIHRRLVLDRLRSRGVNLVTGITKGEVHGQRFSLQDREGTAHQLPFDTLVLAAGRDPLASAWDTLRQRVKELFIVGDALDPRGIMEAVAEGNLAGRMV